MGDAGIFLCTNSGDNESNVASTAKVIFNNANVPDPTNESFMIRTSWNFGEDIAEQPRPTQNLNNIQPQKLGFGEVILTGFVDDPTNSQDLTTLFNTMIAAKRNSDFKKGRIGLRTDKLPMLTLTPSTFIGYILVGFSGYLTGDEGERQAAIILKLRRNGTI